jgi:transposase
MGRSQGGFGTKLHLICDGEGTPIAVAVGPGQEHETQQAIPLLEEALAWPEQPAKVAGDKEYSAGWLRDWLKERDKVYSAGWSAPPLHRCISRRTSSSDGQSV